MTGRQPSLQQGEFEGRWCGNGEHRGVLCLELEVGLENAAEVLQPLLLTYSYGITYRKSRPCQTIYGQTSTIPTDRRP